jgi:acylphosphatase
LEEKMQAHPPEQTSTAPARLHLHFRGRVQGVGFRAFVASRARQHGLTGWVRNVGRDGVEAAAEGPRRSLEPFLEAVRGGPPGARVEALQADWQAPTGEFTGFDIRSSR